MSRYDDFLDLDQMEREIDEANKLLLRHVALCVALGLVSALVAAVVA